MKAIPTILLVYCLAVALVCIGLGALNAHSMFTAESKLESSLLTASEANKAVDTAGALVRELESNQRHHRAEYSGEEAVDTSFKIQQAKAVYEQAHQNAQQAQVEVEALEQTIKTAQIRFVPLAALLMVHLFGAAFFKPTKP